MTADTADMGGLHMWVALAGTHAGAHATRLARYIPCSATLETVAKINAHVNLQVPPTHPTVDVSRDCRKMKRRWLGGGNLLFLTGVGWGGQPTPLDRGWLRGETYPS